MKYAKQIFISLAALMFMMSQHVQAQTSPPASTSAFPVKPIRLIVPFPAGGATDILARALAQTMGEKLAQSVVVENRPGAGGTMGSDQVAKSAADGYTLLMATTSTHAIAPLINAKLPYNVSRDFTPIGHVADSPNVLLVPSSLNVNTLSEFTALMRSKPGKYNYGSSGIGTIVHVSTELFKSQAGLFITHIPYRGTGLVIPDLKAGQIHMLFDGITSAQPHLQDGKLKVLGVASPRRSSLMPNVPTIREAAAPADKLADFDAVTWFGLYAPKGMPEGVADALTRALNASLQDKDLRERMLRLGAEPAEAKDGKQFAAMVQADSAKWSRIINERKITAE